MYAIIKTGGKQYRVQEGQSLLIERLPDADGDTVQLTPLLIVDGEHLRDGDALSGVTVPARILSHERGPKLRVVKFKPKRGYKRRAGHRQELTRIEIGSLGGSGSGSGSGGKRARAAGAAPVGAQDQSADQTEVGNGS